jgi:hypothetical protein
VGKKNNYKNNNVWGVSCHIDDKNFWLFWFFVFFLQRFFGVCVCVFVFFGLICIATIVDDDDDDDWRGTEQTL